MNPLIGRTCVIVDLEGGVEGVKEPEEVRTPAIVVDVQSAPSRVRAGEQEMIHTDTWVLLVLLEGGTLRCVSHRDVVMT